LGDISDIGQLQCQNSWEGESKKPHVIL